MDSKKILATISLCLMLLTIPFVLNIDAEPDIPNYENGVWRDGPFPEGCYIPPGTTPNVTYVEAPPSMACLEGVVSTVAATAGFEEQKIQMTILLALEEEYYAYNYFTPYGKINGYLYALLQVERASQYFEEVYNVELVVVGSTTWHQDEKQDILALFEVYEETEFKHNMVWNGYVVEVLLAWTLKLKYGTINTHGIALLYDTLSGKWYCTAVVRYCAYWMDDNLVQHEISHLFNASDGKTIPGTEYYSDCYYADCVMSYRTRVDVETVEEDGIIWTIPQSERPIGVTFLTNNWCEDSREEVIKWKWLYAQRDYIDPPYQGDC